MTNLAHEIDTLTDAMYRNRAFAGELGSLARLFSSGYWDRLGDVLRREFRASKWPRHGGPMPPLTLDTGIGWIDKGPYADFQPPQSGITQRVEIGDAALIRVEKITHPGGTSVNASCVILQAKVGDTDPPLVPVARPGSDPNDSTNKEMKLLEGWPAFDLYKASRSKKVLASGIALSNGAPAVSPYGWFIGADPDWQNRNRNFWMAGPARNGALCESSFGTLVERFMKSTKISHAGLGQSVGVGSRFTYDGQRVTDLRGGARPLGNDWDELCHQLLAIIPDRSVPKNASGTIAMPGRMGITVNSFPALHTLSGILPSFQNAWLNLALGRRPVVLIYMNSLKA